MRIVRVGAATRSVPGGKPRSAAFTLIEVLVTIFLITVFFSVSAVVFNDITRLRGLQERYNQRVDAADALLRQIAADVRPGRAFLASDGEISCGADAVILARDHAVITYRRAGPLVERIERRDGKTRRQTVLNDPKLIVRFELEGAPATARSVVTTIEWDESPQIGISHPAVSLRTALRNR